MEKKIIKGIVEYRKKVLKEFYQDCITFYKEELKKLDLPEDHVDGIKKLIESYTRVIEKLGNEENE